MVARPNTESKVGGNGNGNGNGWYKVPNDVLRKHGLRLGLAGIGVYNALAMHADTEGRSRPSQARLAELLGISDRTIRRAIRRLVRAKLVRVQSGKKDGRSSDYLLLAHPGGGRTPEHHPPPGGRTPEHQGSDTTAPGGRTPEHHEQYPLNKTQEQHTRVCGFDSFWKSYPNPRNKTAARQAWDEINPDSPLQAIILRALEAEKRSDHWRRGIGIPNPERWLRERRWEDGGGAGSGASPRETPEEYRARRDREDQASRAGMATPEEIREMLAGKIGNFPE